MGKGINKLSKSQKNVPPKSQTRISAFFGRAPAAPTSSISEASNTNAKPSNDNTAILRRSPRKRPAIIDVTDRVVSRNSSPLKAVLRPPAVNTEPKTPPRVIDLDDSDVIPSSGGNRDGKSGIENRMTGITGRTSAVKDETCGGGAMNGGVGGAPGGDPSDDTAGDPATGAGAFDVNKAALNGPQLVQRLTKRPARAGLGLSPSRKRSTGPDGVATNVTDVTTKVTRNFLGGASDSRSPRKLKDIGKSQGSPSVKKLSVMSNFPRRSPRKRNGCLLGKMAPKKSREPSVLDLEDALLAGEVAAGLTAIARSDRDDTKERRCGKLSTSTEVPILPVLPTKGSSNNHSQPRGSTDLAASRVNIDSVTTITTAETVAKCDLSETNVAAVEADVKTDATETISAAAIAAVSPQKRSRPRTPESEQASELLFESDLFTSPFKEETPARPAAAPLRCADPSVPAWQRFDRYSVSFVQRQTDGSTVLSLQAAEPGYQDRVITLRDSWSTTAVHLGDTVHVLSAPNDVINNVSGQLIVNPDRLISGTSVVSAVFCARKAVLSEMFRGLEPGNKAMLVGTLVHQLFQEVMRHRLCTAAAVRSRISELLRQNSAVSAAYGSKISSAQLAEELEQFVAPILAWVRRYTEWGRDAEVVTSIPGNGATPAPHSGETWDGRVTELKDIEENYWSPRLGVKGKIDLTVEVKCRKRPSQVLPLELKTGRPSFSAEHQGQVTLYSMMTSERRPDPGAGLLLYLRTGGMREVSAGPHQQRDLLQLRNRLVHHLSSAPAPVTGTASDTGTGTGVAARTDCDAELELPPLPEVIRNERACQRCPHLVTCAAYQRPSDPPHAVPSSPSHLLPSHLSYFLHWSLLLRLESSHCAPLVSMSRLWVLPSSERQSSGYALAGCPLRGVRRAGGGFVHRFGSTGGRAGGMMAEGDLVMVGTDDRLAICMGSLLELAEEEVHVLLDRDLTTYPGGAELRYHVDKCEYQPETSTGTYFSSLARLLENTEHSRRLRELLIDRRPPAFLPGLGRLVVTKCRAILRPLNKLQQRALLRVMMAEDYLLIQGMPGTGKTSTIVALVRLLVTMGRSVLLASYTHSAVDTILLKLKDHFADFVRLGRPNRVHRDLQPFCSDNITQSLVTPEDMEAFYDSKPVVATTCLGTNHPVFQRRKFDICIIDEASQIVQPAAIAPVLLAGRFVLVGDPEQLPPVIQSPAARRRGMDECLFSRLTSGDNTVQLTVQYRMNRVLTAAANHLTYRGRLSCGSEEVEDATMQEVERKPTDPSWLAACLDPALARSLLLLDTSDLDWRHASDKHGAVTNVKEAALVAHIAAEMVQRGLCAEHIGVIAPYRGQVRLLRSSLPAAVEVNTVDQYQGRDKAVILYSCTKTAARRADETTESTDILSDHRRLTVAVTRAKHKLIVVGRRATLCSYRPFARLFSHLRPEDSLRVAPGQVSGLEGS